MPTPAAAARAASHASRVFGLLRNANSVSSGSVRGALLGSCSACRGGLTAGNGSGDSQRTPGPGAALESNFNGSCQKYCDLAPGEQTAQSTAATNVKRFLPIPRIHNCLRGCD